MTDPGTLRQQLQHQPPLLAPGVYDGLSALLAERAGFTCAYVSGASIAYTRFGRPDIGLVSMREVADVVSDLRERVSLPLIVDGDTGFGNALNVIRTVRLFERLGASALQIEDQVMPKRCGHLAEKSVVPPGEMVGKVKAAVDARRSEDFLVIARTDALSVEGLDAAMERAARYAEAGADMLFVEAPASQDDLERIGRTLGARAPLMANMVEGGRTPMRSAAELGALGFSLVIFPGGLVRAFAHMAQQYFDSLRHHGSNQPFRDRMVDFGQLNELLQTRSMLELGQRYESDD